MSLATKNLNFPLSIKISFPKWSFVLLSSILRNCHFPLSTVRHVMWITVIPAWFVDWVCANNILYSVCTIKEFFRKWISERTKQGQNFWLSLSYYKTIYQNPQSICKLPSFKMWILLNPENGVMFQYANAPVSLFGKKKGRYFKYESIRNLKGVCRNCTAILLLTAQTYCTKII